MQRRVIISLCDHSGNWTRPYAEAGYLVLRIDPKHAGRTGGGTGIVRDGEDDPETYDRYGYQMEDGGWAVGITAGEFARSVTLLGLEATIYDLTGISGYDRAQGVIAQPPCTDFTVSGAQYWPAKDADGRTERSLQIVRECLDVVRAVNPVWWVLENPVGRLPRLLPQLGWYQTIMQPWHYGDAYTKATCLWGLFNLPRDASQEVTPIRACSQGSWLQKLGGKSERTKELRSATPMGFARHFFRCNP
jgi:hypothetical protein